MEFFAESFARALHLILSADAELVAIVRTSLSTSCAAVLIASVLAIPAGIGVAITQFPGKKALRHGLNALMALPTVVVGLLLYGLLSRQGPLGSFNLLFSPLAIVIGQTVLVIPLLWNLVWTAAQSADPRIIFTCRTFGAGRYQQARIVLHECRRPVVAATILTFGRAIGEVGVAMMLGGNIAHYTRTMTTAIALETSKGEFALGMALGLLLLLVALLTNLALSLLDRRSE